MWPLIVLLLSFGIRFSYSCSVGSNVIDSSACEHDRNGMHGRKQEWVFVCMRERNRQIGREGN